jgi:hypothetical protein
VVLAPVAGFKPLEIVEPDRAFDPSPIQVGQPNGATRPADQCKA